MYHSITIGDKNTWDDWWLIPSSRPLVNPPAVNEKRVSIQGVDGEIDLTEFLSGSVTYTNRTGQWSFILAPDHWTWTTAYSTIMNYLHGKTFQVILEDDPGHYYEGRLSVSSWKSSSSFSTITIDYNFAPEKKAITT